MKVMVAAAVVALALALLLIWRSASLTRGVYRFGFFLGLAALAAIFVSRLPVDRSTSPGGGEMTIHLGSGALARTAYAPIVWVALTPFILLVEVGIAGYRGFSSWMRYVSLLLAVVGGAGLIASVLIPRLLRR
jgi:hypothetical protein